MTDNQESGGNGAGKRSATLQMLESWDNADLSITMNQMPGGFQNQVNVQPAPAVAGDFASANPRATYNAGPGGLVAGTGGVTVGNFAWVSGNQDPDNTATIVNNFPTGLLSGTSLLNPFPLGTVVAGFVHREGQALITQYLADATLVIPQGFPVIVSTQGDFWCKNTGTALATLGQKAYANFSNGSVFFANTGSTFGATGTGSVSTSNIAITGSILGDILTVTSTAGFIPIGATVSGTSGGTAVALNTFITGQISGSVGGTGTYSVSIPEQSVLSSANLFVNYMVLTAGSLSAGTLTIGSVFTWTGTGAFATGSTLTYYGTGTGTGTGTYYVSPAGPTTGSINFSTTSNAVETKWYAASQGATGELVKITSWVGTQG